MIFGVFIVIVAVALGVAGHLRRRAGEADAERRETIGRGVARKLRRRRTSE